MPKFKVWFVKDINVCVEVEAESAYKAEIAASKKFNSLTEEERHKDEAITYQYSDYQLCHVTKGGE